METNLEQTITSKIGESKLDEVQLLNSSTLSESPSDAHSVIKELLRQHKDRHRKSRNDLAFAISVEKVYELSNAIEHLDKKFHEHTQMLRQNEGSLISGTNTVLEYDSAKSKTDKLVEVLKAKIIWTNTSEEIQLLEPTDRSLKFQKLVSLQKSFDVLHKYAENSERERAFEQQKDEFLSWFSSATVLAIDSNDVKQLESLKEKFLMLNRYKAFEETFGSFARNKIKCFIDEKGKEYTVWDILQEVFSVWKKCYRLAESFIGPYGSKLIASNLYDGVLSKWSVFQNIVTDLTTTSANDPFVAAREIGKVCNDFLEYVSSEGDEQIVEVSNRICQKIFSVMGDGYRKHVTFLLLCTINKITAPEKSSRFRHNWVFPYLEEIHSCMREMISETRSTFGPHFSPHIVPSFEEGIKELNSLIRNQDILNIKRENADVRTKRTVQENTEDKISAICVTGALMNIVHEVNRHILDCYGQTKFKDVVEPRLISNINLLERLNKKVVERKIESIANAIIYSMDEEMQKLKLSAATTSEAGHSMKLSLPSFSISPHNYITSVGHGLLSQMNSLGSYGTDNNFVNAIGLMAGKDFNEEEADLWVLSEVAKYVMDAFCRNVGNVSQLNATLVRQFHADIVFFMEALVDLRLQPTPRLTDFASKLKKALSN